MEKILAFSLPSIIIPNLRLQSAGEQNEFMKRTNQNAANGHHKLRVSGGADHNRYPLAVSFAILGGVLARTCPAPSRTFPGTC
jgi:hypothetical protein